MVEFWEGLGPQRCEICNEPIRNVFIIGRTAEGTWSILCPDCNNGVGAGLGMELGQVFRKAACDDGLVRSVWLTIRG